MAILSLTKAYAQAIFLDGTKRFVDIRTDYVEPVKEYAAINYSDEQINNSLSQGWITQQEYDETMAYKPSETPTV